MDRRRVGIIIPAFNESATIKNIVRLVSIYGLPIVIDDGSTDNTAKFAEAAGAVVISRKKNSGYDAALNVGFAKAIELKVKIIITIDADGQHDPSLIQEFINAIDSGADIVIGIRNIRQRFAEYLFSWYTNLRFGLQDPLCGMKAYKMEIYKALGYFDSYSSIGTELSIFALMKGFRVEQIPFNVRRRKDLSRFGQTFFGNCKIIRAMILSFWYLRSIKTG